MSVRSLGTTFASRLHREYLQPLSFKKPGNTFSRVKPGYLEMFNLQGSDWNSGQEPWLFYVNVRVSFTDLAADSLPAHLTKYQADGRLNRIVEAPPSFELTAANVEELLHDVAKLIVQASNCLPGLLPPIRARAACGLFSAIPHPSTWERPDAPPLAT